MRIPYHILGKSFYSHQPSFLLLCIFNFALNLYTSNSATLKNVTLKTLHIWWSPQEKKQLFFRKGFDFSIDKYLKSIQKSIPSCSHQQVCFGRTKSQLLGALWKHQWQKGGKSTGIRFFRPVPKKSFNS